MRNSIIYGLFGVKVNDDRPWKVIATELFRRSEPKRLRDCTDKNVIDHLIFINFRNEMGKLRNQHRKSGTLERDPHWQIFTQNDNFDAWYKQLDDMGKIAYNTALSSLTEDTEYVFLYDAKGKSIPTNFCGLYSNYKYLSELL